MPPTLADFRATVRAITDSCLEQDDLTGFSVALSSNFPTLVVDLRWPARKTSKAWALHDLRGWPPDYMHARIRADLDALASRRIDESDE